MLFNWSVSLVRGATQFKPLDAQFSLVGSWRDYEAVPEVERLAVYVPRRPHQPLQIWDVSNAYFSFLDDYRLQNPQQYKEWTDWVDRHTQTQAFFYGATELGLLVLLAGGLYFVNRCDGALKRRPALRRKRPPASRSSRAGYARHVSRFSFLATCIATDRTCVA